MNIRKQISRLGWAFVLFYFVSTITQVAVSVGLALFARSLPEWVIDQDIELFFVQCAMYLVGFPAFFLAIKRIPAWKKSIPQSLSAGRFVRVLVICYALAYLGNFLGQFFVRALETLVGVESYNPVADIMGEMNLWVTGVTTVLIAPVMEELMFRKLFLDRVVFLGQRGAVFLSGLCFALFHGNFYQFFYALLLGMAFAYIYTSTGRLGYCIALHMAINLVGGFLTVVLSQWCDTGAPAALMVLNLFSCFILGMIVLGVIFAAAEFRHIRWFSGWTGKRRVWPFCLTAPGMLAFWAVCVLAWYR